MKVRCSGKANEEAGTDQQLHMVVSIFNFWMWFSAIEDQKILQRTVFFTANTQTPNTWKLQLRNRKVSSARGFFCSFWRNEHS